MLAQKPGESAQWAYTRRKSCYTPKASPRGERLPHFMLVQLSLTINVRLIPTISPVTHWCLPSALAGVPHPHSPPVTSPTHRHNGPQTRRSTTDRFDTRAHTGLTPTGHWASGLQPPKCARAQEIADPALIPIIGPKTRRVGPMGAHPEEVLLHPKS